MKEIYDNLKFLLEDYAKHKSSRSMLSSYIVDMLYTSEKRFKNGEIDKIVKDNIFINILQHLSMITDNKKNIFPINLKLSRHSRILEDEPNVLISDISFEDMAIPYIQLNRCILKNIDFTGAILHQLILKNCVLISCNVNEVVIHKSTLQNCHITNCSFNNASMRLSTWDDCNLIACTFHNSCLVSACFKTSRLIGCAFDQQPDRLSSRQISENSDLTDSAWTECKLEACTFQDSILFDAKFKKTKLIGTSLELANTTGIQGVSL